MFRTALALLVALALPLPAPAQEMPGPQTSVGRLNFAGYNRLRMCTGALVAPDLVLTAAHCVLDPDGYARRPEDMVFVAGWDGAGHAGASAVTQIEAHPRAFHEGRVDIAHDLAIVTLETPLALPVLALGIAPAEGPFTLLGYPRSAPHRVRRDTGCDGEVFRDIWRLSCRVERGQSGGPVLYGEGSGQRIVAVLSAIAGDRALAVPVDGWLRRRLAR